MNLPNLPILRKNLPVKSVRKYRFGKPVNRVPTLTPRRFVITMENNTLSLMSTCLTKIHSIPVTLYVRTRGWTNTWKNWYRDTEYLYSTEYPDNIPIIIRIYPVFLNIRIFSVVFDRIFGLSGFEYIRISIPSQWRCFPLKIWVL